MRKKRKTELLQLLIMVLIILFSLPAAVSGAEENVKLSASEEKAHSGETVTVTIWIENAKGTEGGQFVLNFNPARVKPVSVESGSLVSDATSGMHMVNKEYDSGQMKFMWVTAAADTVDEGVLFEVQFELLEAGESTLDFADLIISPDEIEPQEPVSGKITVEEAGVEQEEIAENETNHENDENEALPGDQDNDDDLAVGAESEGGSITLIIILIALAVLGLGGFYFFRKSQKAYKPKHSKK